MHILKKYKTGFLLILLLWCNTVLHAQRLPFVTYTTSNGLIHNRVHLVRQDGKGYIWMGTDMGLCRYDGRSFKHYPCPASPYRSVRYATEYKGALYFSIDYYGLVVCLGDSVRFIPIKEKFNSVCGMTCLNDTSFLVNNMPGGLYAMNPHGDTKRIMLPAPVKNEWSFVDMLLDKRRTLWLLTNMGLVILPNADLKHPVMPKALKDVYINVVRQDNNGDIYVATHTGVYMYTAQQCANKQFDNPRMLLDSVAEVTSMAFDDEDNVWLSTTFRGLLKYNKKTGQYKQYKVDNGLISNNAWDVFNDKENNIWAACETGVSKLTTQHYYSYDFINSDYQHVRDAVFWNDSTLLFTNIVDLYSITNDRLEKIKGYKNIPGYEHCILMKMPDNKLLVNDNTPITTGSFQILTNAYNFSGNALHNGVAVKELGGPRTIRINETAQQYSNEVWIQSWNRHLYLYKEGKFKKQESLTLNGKPAMPTYVVPNAAGDLWIVHEYYNVAFFKKIKSDTAATGYRFEQQLYIPKEKISNQYIFRVLQDSRGYVWLCGREFGVTLLKPNKDGKTYSINNLPLKTFSSGVINDIMEDGQHNIWLCTASGLDKVVFSADTFTVEKDLYSTELCGKYIFFAKIMRGKMYVGTTGCLGVIDINKKDKIVPPAVYIADIKINEHSRKGLLSASPRLSPNDNNISFTFTGISFRDEHHVKYSYILEGQDNNWSTPRTEHSITYSHIPPGTYTFKVKVMSAQGVWSERPATFTFTIAQPFYTRWWFILLSAAAVFGIIYTIYRYRINRLVEIQCIRETISKDLHDDIGATVSSINILANMAKSDLVSDSKRNQFLETILEESKHVSESLNDIVWSINPKNDTLEIMFARMQRYASELFEAANVSYEFVLPDAKLDSLSMDMTKRQHVYLLFKEAVNNLVKYAEATKAEVTLCVENSTFTMKITDNGKGFDANTSYAGNGILNMRKRAKDIDAQLTINSTLGKGTTITLQAPF